MKRIRLILLLSFVCFGSFSCKAEETETGAAVLVFSSFDGGGPEYTITIEDPQTVSYTCRKEYDDPDGESLPGAGYRNLFTFTGIQPGTTKMTVSMSSPLMESNDAVYTVIVDDDLNVTLNQDREISTFELYRYGEIAYDSYSIVPFMDGYSVSVNGEEFQSIDQKYVDELFQVVEEYDLYKWDGFDKSQENVLDGEGFLLEIGFTDGTSIYANGDNAFPEDYFSAMGQMQEILDGIKAEKKPGITMDMVKEFLDGFLTSITDR